MGNIIMGLMIDDPFTKVENITIGIVALLLFLAGIGVGIYKLLT